MTMTYNTWTDAIQRMMVETTTDMNFAAMLPRMIEYAEGRIYRELDLLNTVISDASGSLTAGLRSYTFPINYLVVETINLITPAGSTPDAGTRNPLTTVSKEYLNFAWPSNVGATLPSSFAVVTDQSIIVGPWPNANYTVEVVGTIIPLPLSSTNTTTFLTQRLPDLFLAATMIFATGFKQNFGAQANDPQQSQSWETQYTKLATSAAVIEMRRRWSGPGWTSKMPTPLVNS